MSSLESQPLPHSKIQMTGSWDVFLNAWSLTPLRHYSESTLQFNDIIEYPRLLYVYRFWTVLVKRRTQAVVPPTNHPQASAPVPVAGILKGKGSRSHHGELFGTSLYNKKAGRPTDMVIFGEYFDMTFWIWMHHDASCSSYVLVCNWGIFVKMSQDFRTKATMISSASTWQSKRLIETTNISEPHNTSTQTIYELENFSNDLSTTTPAFNQGLPCLSMMLLCHRWQVLV